VGGRLEIESAKAAMDQASVSTGDKGSGAGRVVIVPVEVDVFLADRIGKALQRSVSHEREELLNTWNGKMAYEFLLVIPSLHGIGDPYLVAAMTSTSALPPRQQSMLNCREGY
jgi:hypothetical protein